MKYDNKQLNPPGLKDMKAVDLYFKYRKFLPKEFQDITCPRPAQDIIDTFKGERNTKQRARASKNLQPQL